MANIIYDPVLGWRRKPGHARAAIGEISWTWDIGPHGFRTLPNTPQNPKNSAWIFGCSFTEGQCLNIEETYCYLLQERFPHTEIVPFAIAGYSSLQNLLQLKALLVTGQPDVVVFSFFHFHLIRNVSDPVLWINRKSHPAFGKSRDAKGHAGEIFRPSGLLREDGSLAVRRVNSPRSEEEYQGMLAYRPDPFTKQRVSELVYLQAKELSEAAGARFYVAALRSGDSIENGGAAATPPLQQPFLARLIELGIDVIDADPNLPLEDTTFLPVDNHPNAFANRHFATCIGDALTKDLS